MLSFLPALWLMARDLFEGGDGPPVVVPAQRGKAQVGQRIGDDVLARILMFIGVRQGLFAERRRPLVVALQHGRVYQAKEGHTDPHRVPRLPRQSQALSPQDRRPRGISILVEGQ